jgi:hypothetical protein
MPGRRSWLACAFLMSALACAPDDVRPLERAATKSSAGAGPVAKPPFPDTVWMRGQLSVVVGPARMTPDGDDLPFRTDRFDHDAFLSRGTPGTPDHESEPYVRTGERIVVNGELWVRLKRKR